jgi:hypothetical protein
MLDKLTIDHFKEHIGSTFQATPSLGGDAFELELRRADPSHHAAAEGDDGKQDRERDPFSIEFHSRLPHHVPQQIFALEHDGLGKLDLFLVPLGPDADGHRYEAVFG